MKRKTSSAKPRADYPILTYVILANLLVLDIFFVLNYFKTNPNVLGESTQACPKACVSLINNTGSISSSAAKEYFVSLGTGTNQTDDWTDVTGALAYIDTTQYRKIKKATFEATLEVPDAAQISYVRLYNVTDKHPVWFSEMTMDVSGPKLLVSASITLDSGLKQYQVQMKSQLKYPLKLIQSRVHILTN